MNELGLGFLGLIFNAIDYIREKSQKHIPAECFNNKALLYEDKMNPNVSPQQVMKNLEKGKYYSPEVIPEHYDNPVKIVDRKSYEADILEYGKEVADANAKLGLYSFVLNSN